LKDAIRFVPELASLAATALAHHRAEEGRRPESDVIGFGKPDGRPWTGLVVRFPVQRSRRLRERLGLAHGDRLAVIDEELRKIERMMAALAADKAAVLREYHREIWEMRGET
jgi:hypothetical protein